MTTALNAAPFRFMSVYLTFTLLMAFVIPSVLTLPGTPFQEPDLQTLTTLVVGVALLCQWVGAPLTILYGFLAGAATEHRGWRALHVLSIAAGVFVLLVAMGRVFLP